MNVILNFNIKHFSMKKLITLVIIAGALQLTAQENKTIRVGLTWGFQGNDVTNSGGMQEASGRFRADGGGGAFGFAFRYDHDNHWMATAGMGVQSFGFNFYLSQNYSFLHPELRDKQVLKNEFGAIEAPIMLHYKFNPDCRNKRWVIGAGWVNGFISNNTNSAVIGDGRDIPGYTMISSGASNQGYYAMLRFSVAREKTFKRGAILNATLLFNAGFRELATAKVDYFSEGSHYYHEFNTSGNFVGLRLNYFFRPLVGRTAK